MKPDQIKVLHVVFSLEAGGTENVLTKVACALDPDEFDVHVCCLERRGIYADRLPDGHVVTLNKPPGKSLAAARRLRGVIHRIRPDIIHTHNFGPLIYSALATGLGRSGTILHGIHGQLIDTDLSTLRLLQRRCLYRCARRVHTVSLGLREQLLALRFPPDRIVAVVNGVDTEAFKPGDRRLVRDRLGLSSDGHVVGIVGRLSENKRHKLLLTAAAELRATVPDIHVLIVGEGPEMSSLRRLASDLAIADRVHFVGFLDDPVPCYQAMDLLVLPSRQEGLANSVLEAMACELPVVTHDACGNSEVISNDVDGWVAALDSAQDLAALIQTAFADIERLRSIGRAARRTMIERFSFDRTVGEYAQLYRELVEEQS